MAETNPKRPREDDHSDLETTKRHRNFYINEQQEATQDLSDFVTSLSSDTFLVLTRQPEPDPDDNSSSNPSVKEESVDDEDEKERMIRHLLEASDDELGLPTKVDGGRDGGDGGNSSGGDYEVSVGEYGDFSLALCDGLWELEDEAANYYTLLQSELFMQ